MMKLCENKSICTVLSYTSFVSECQDDMNYCTTIEKFERDMAKLIDDGYTCISLKTYLEIRRIKNVSFEKYFCLAFQGGYIDNFLLAFPVIKKMELPVSIFVATDLIGVNQLKDSINYIPHFGWNEAQEMVETGLISIHPMWHPMDFGKKFQDEIEKKIDLLNSHIVNNDSKLALSYSTISIEELDILKQMGIMCNLVDCFRITREGWDKGSIPIISVNYKSDILDTIDQFDDFVCRNLKRDGFASVAKKEYGECNDNFSETISLPIDHQPMVRNYLRHAFSLSIIQAHRIDRAERIILCDYIDVVFKPMYHVFDFHTYGCENMRGLECMKITKDFFCVNPIGINTVIINGLKKGYYSDIWLDTFYIPGKSGYDKRHSTHGILIYEYRKENKSYSALSYTSEGHFETLTVSLEAIEYACSNDYFSHLNMLKNENGVVIEYDVKELKLKLSNYINSICMDDNARFNKKGSTQYYNFEASLQFSKCISSLEEKNEEVHLTSLYSFAEQKKVMAWRIQYISSKEKIEIQNLQKRVDKIKGEAALVVTYGIKYNLTKSSKALAKLKNIIDALNMEEKYLLQEFLSQLN